MGGAARRLARASGLKAEELEDGRLRRRQRGKVKQKLSSGSFFPLASKDMGSVLPALQLHEFPTADPLDSQHGLSAEPKKATIKTPSL